MCALCKTGANSRSKVRIGQTERTPQPRLCVFVAKASSSHHAATQEDYIFSASRDVKEKTTMIVARILAYKGKRGWLELELSCYHFIFLSRYSAVAAEHITSKMTEEAGFYA